MGDAGAPSGPVWELGAGLGYATPMREGVRLRSHSGLCRHPSPLLCSRLGGDADKPEDRSIPGGPRVRRARSMGVDGWMGTWEESCEAKIKKGWVVAGRWRQHSEWTNLAVASR